MTTAGDLAPDVVWTRILAGDEPTGFPGRVTVITFFPVVSLNKSLVSRWNALVARFAGQPVHFVWVASEYKPPLDGWLAIHPVSGCLLLDPLGVTARAYGSEFGSAIVNVDGRIAGFTFDLPEERQIKAVENGSAIAIEGDATESQLDEILAGRAERLDLRPHRMPVPVLRGKPEIPPSLEVRISPSETEEGTDETQGAGWWVQRGFDLKTVIAKVYEQDPSRIVLPEEFQNEERYDFVLVLPHKMEAQAMRHMLRQTIEQHFQVSSAVEIRPTDVYVMTAIEGKTPAANTGDAGLGGGSIGWSAQTFTMAQPPGGRRPTPGMFREVMARARERGISTISAFNADMAGFRRALEEGLGRQIIDETNLAGTYNLVISGNAQSNEEFLGMLRDDLGLVLTPDHRKVEMLVITRLPTGRGACL